MFSSRAVLAGLREGGFRAVLVGIGCLQAAGNHPCQDLLDSIALRPRARAVCSSLRFRDCHYSYSGSVLGENKWL